MKFNWYKQLSVLLVIAMLVGMLPVYAAAANDGKQATVFHFVDNSDATKISAAHGFFSTSPAFTYEEEGQKYFEIAVPKVYDLVLTIEGGSGDVVEETATHTVRKYKVSAYETALSSVTSYTMPEMGAHAPAVRLVIGNDIDAIKSQLESELVAADKLENPTANLTNVITAAKTANTYLTLKADMQTALANLKAAIAEHGAGEPSEPSQPTDPEAVTEADLASLTTALAAANAVVTKDVALVTAISQATAALEDETLVLSELKAFVERLNHLVTTNDEVLASLKPVTVDYVKSTDLNASFNKSFAGFFSNTQTFEAAGKTYLRIQVTTKYNMKFTVEEKAGKTASYVGDTAVVYDYELSSLVEPVLSVVDYVAQTGQGTHVGHHEQYLVFNQDATDTDRTALKTAIATATAITNKTTALSEALTAAQEVNNLLARKAVLNAATGALEAAIEDNRVVNETDLGPLQTALTEAKAVENKDVALVTAISQAEAALTDEDLIVAELKAFVERLNHLVTTNDEVLASLKPVTVDYVKSTDLNTSFNKSFAGFFSNTQTFEAAGKTYLRIQVTTKYNMKFTVEEKAGKAASYVGDTAVVYDYELSSLVEPVLSVVDYVAQTGQGTHVGHHEQYLVFNQDATDADRTALKTAIATATAITNKTTALSEALTAAQEVNNLLARKAVLNAATAVLNQAIANHNSSNSGTPQFHEGTGLQTGKYLVSISALKHNSNESSIMNDYIAATARLEVTTGSLIVYIPMKNASMIQSLSVEGKSASVAEMYWGSNVARYVFTVSTLTGKLDASTHVIAILDGKELYNTTHSIELVFGSPVKVDSWPDEGFIREAIKSPEDEDKQETDEEKESTTENGSEEEETSTSAPKFSDIAGSWAQAAIERAVSLKLVNGYTDGSFKPNSSINRAEFTAIIARALKLEAASGQLQFADTGNVQDWAKPYIQQAVEAGIVTGFADKTFRPAANITRIEMAVMLVKGLGLDQEQAEAVSFKDAADIPAWAQRYVAIAVKHGLIKGNTDGTFKPNQAATRAEAITIALRAVDYKNN